MPALNSESEEAKVLKQEILCLIEKARNEGIKRGFDLGYMLGQIENRNRSLIPDMPGVLMESEEVRMNYQWTREGL